MRCEVGQMVVEGRLTIMHAFALRNRVTELDRCDALWFLLREITKKWSGERETGGGGWERREFDSPSPRRRVAVSL